MTPTKSSRIRLAPEPASRFPDLASVTGTVELLDGGVATVRWDGRQGVSCWRVGDLEVVTRSSATESPGPDGSWVLHTTKRIRT